MSDWTPAYRASDGSCNHCGGSPGMHYPNCALEPGATRACVILGCLGASIALAYAAAHGQIIDIGRPRPSRDALRRHVLRLTRFPPARA